MRESERIDLVNTPLLGAALSPLSAPRSSGRPSKRDGLSTFTLRQAAQFHQLSNISNDCHSPFHTGPRQHEVESESLSQESVQDVPGDQQGVWSPLLFLPTFCHVHELQPLFPSPSNVSSLSIAKLILLRNVN